MSVPTFALIHPDHIAHNVRLLKQQLQAETELLAVIKADGYGHGDLTIARAAIAGGATWLGVAHVDQAIRLRQAGITAPIMAWIFGQSLASDQIGEAIEYDIDFGLGTPRLLPQIKTAAAQHGKTARIHLKVETGMGRNGVAVEDAAALAAQLDAEPGVSVHGLFSHLAQADSGDQSYTDYQAERFQTAAAACEKQLGKKLLKHLTASAGTLARKDLHYDLVRAGLAIYGYNPFADIAAAEEQSALPESVQAASKLRFLPAMTLCSELTTVKRVSAGQGISYGSTYRPDIETFIGIVPAGYADGIHRAASGKFEVLVISSTGAVKAKQVGRICMDQFMVDLGPDTAAEVGDKVIIFGAALDFSGLVPDSAEDLARAAGTIAWEVLTSISSRVPRYELAGSEVREFLAGAKSFSELPLAASTFGDC